MRRAIKPSDVVLHKPSGEKWIVAGVNRENGTLIPMGYPFPSIAQIKDCKLVEARYEAHAQDETTISALIKHGLISYVDALSAMFHGIDLMPRRDDDAEG